MQSRLIAPTKVNILANFEEVNYASYLYAKNVQTKIKKFLKTSLYNFLLGLLELNVNTRKHK